MQKKKLFTINGIPIPTYPPKNLCELTPIRRLAKFNFAIKIQCFLVTVKMLLV